MAAKATPEPEKASGPRPEEWSFASQNSESNRPMADWTEAREKAERGYASRIAASKREGIEEVARNALAEGLSVEVVSKVTGLAPETIAGLRN